MTGVLTPPNSSTSFFDLPKDQQIGGYPSLSQLSESSLDAATLDSEGRCVILEFPAFVLIGTYCPANRDESRDEFRLGFLNALDARIRNLVAAGKKVLLTGDLNIIRDELDTAKCEEQLRKEGITFEQYISTPARRMFNQLVVGGRVVGERDEGREKPVMWDLCRGFHPTRKGMFTCWEQKINARPGNFGSRIDYILCGENWKHWFCEANIQEGLIGSDHCPVYAVLKERVEIEGEEVDIKDIMSDGMFKGGLRQRDWSVKDLCAMSAKLIPEFNRRRSIRDMFTNKPSLPKRESSASNQVSEVNHQDGNPPVGMKGGLTVTEEVESEPVEKFSVGDASQQASVPSEASQATETSTTATSATATGPLPPSVPANASVKRSSETSPSTARPQKRGKSASASRAAITTKGQSARGQSSLMGFFKPKVSKLNGTEDSQNSTVDAESNSASFTGSASEPATPLSSINDSLSLTRTPEKSSPTAFNLSEQKNVIDPIVAKESWAKLLTKRVPPKCEHGEPCVSMLTKKPGENCGRSFYMCSRPLGPSGKKEKNTQWRCGTFIWSSDWTGDGG